MKYLPDEILLKNLQKQMSIHPYKHTTWIPRWNNEETVVSTSFQSGVFVGITVLGP